MHNPTTRRRDDFRDNMSNPAHRREEAENRPVQTEAQRQTGDRAKLKIASLNIKGRSSGTLNKWYNVPQMMRERQIGVLAVQETHMTEDLATTFELLAGNCFHLGYSPDPDSQNAKGVAFVLNKKTVATENVRMEVIVPGRAIAAEIPWRNGESITILNIYAPNVPSEARDFWRQVQEGLRRIEPMQPNVMMGDFNLVEDALDRIPSGTDDPQTRELLREVRTKLNLTDGWRKANADEKGYTWSRLSDGTQSRIDRIYVHESMFVECLDWEHSPAPVPTDHDMVSARVSTPSTPIIGTGRWAIPPRLLKQKRLRATIQEKAKDLQTNLERMTYRTPQRNPQKLLKTFKTEVRWLAKEHERICQPIIASKIAALAKRLRATLNDADQTEEETQLVSIHLRKEIMVLTKQMHQHNRDQVAAVDAAEGEKIGKTWSNRHKANKPRDTLARLKELEGGGTTDDPRRMVKIAATYHDRIQRAGLNRAGNTEGERSRILGLLRAKLSDRSKTALNGQMSEEEVRNAIDKTNRDKAPGLDGIPIELWKSLADQRKDADNRGEPEKRCDIAWILTQVYNDIETYGTDPDAGFSEGCMTPIYKKKDPDDIANYRPITLLNTDYKIFTKAISIRLADAAPEVIHRDQAGFMKGRSIFDQVKTTKLVIDYMGRTNRKGAVVALDQEKAYDKITHDYLWAVLRKFEFPESFIATVASLYTGATTKVMINGELSPPYLITRGVRQGDPLSCLLFDLTIEPLAQTIRRADELRGIPIPGRRDSLKIKLFADDTTVYMSENDDMADLQRVLNQWCAVSGAKFNIEKTEIIPIGNEDQRREIRDSGRLSEWGQALPQGTRIAKEGEPVRILGAWLGNGVDQTTTWAPIMENCSKRLQRWNAGRHSLEGRRLIIQMQIAGVTQYLTMVQGMLSEMETELNRQIRRFTWNHEKADTVNQAQMYAPHGRGGKKILDIEARNKAIHLMWLKTYLNLGEDRATWTYFTDAIIGTDIPNEQRVDEDPESRIMLILQTWRTRGRYLTLPEDLRMMLKLAKEYNVKLEDWNPSQQAKEELPMWYHTKSVASARRNYRTKPAKCLRQKHGHWGREPVFRLGTLQIHCK